jgi:uridine kinase
MTEKDTDGMHNLIEKELSSHEKILKPDFSQKAGRELLAFYLQTKFQQLLDFDSKATEPVFSEVRNGFIQDFSRRLVLNPQKRIMIGITGESASGKSTLCKAMSNVIRSFKMPVSILATDSYFNDISELIKKHGSFDDLRDNGYDVDSPESFQLNTLKEDLNELSLGENIYAPEYLPNGTGVSVPKSKFIPSNKIIIVEGMATMYKDIKDIFDVKIYVETDIEIRKERFLHRAFTERNQDFNNAKKHWEYILVAGQKYVQPAKAFADIIVNGNTNMEYFCQLLEYIHTITNNFDA